MKPHPTGIPGKSPSVILQNSTDVHVRTCAQWEEAALHEKRGGVGGWGGEQKRGHHEALKFTFLGCIFALFLYLSLSIGLSGLSE